MGTWSRPMSNAVQDLNVHRAHDTEMSLTLETQDVHELDLRRS
jgi:hypothetical protein